MVACSLSTDVEHMFAFGFAMMLPLLNCSARDFGRDLGGIRAVNGCCAFARVRICDDVEFAHLLAFDFSSVWRRRCIRAFVRIGTLAEIMVAYVL